jgi:hypothetical protein
MVVCIPNDSFVAGTCTCALWIDRGVHGAVSDEDVLLGAGGWFV